MDLLSEYFSQLQSACGDSDSAPRPEVMDNTAHVASCSLTAAPGVIGLFVLAMALRRVLCPPRLRQTYSGSEDAPELEEIACDDGQIQRRVESYGIRSGRLASARPSDRAAPKAKSKRKPPAEAELQPVLWRR